MPNNDSNNTSATALLKKILEINERIAIINSEIAAQLLQRAPINVRNNQTQRAQRVERQMVRSSRNNGSIQTSEI